MNELWDRIIEDYKIARECLVYSKKKRLLDTSRRQRNVSFMVSILCSYKCRGKEPFVLCKSLIIDGMGNASKKF